MTNDIHLTVRQAVGAEIKKARLAKGFTIEQLAAEAKVSRSTLYVIEGGGQLPQASTLTKIAKALGVTELNI